MSTNRQKFGYATLSSPDGIKEQDAFTCAHCNKIVHIPHKPAQTPGGTCPQCGWKLICDYCVSTGKCDPFEKKLERIEASDRFRRQLQCL